MRFLTNCMQKKGRDLVSAQKLELHFKIVLKQNNQSVYDMVYLLMEFF